MNSVSFIWKFTLVSSYPDIPSHTINYFKSLGAIKKFPFDEYSNPLKQEKIFSITNNILEFSKSVNFILLSVEQEYNKSLFFIII